MDVFLQGTRLGYRMQLVVNTRHSFETTCGAPPLPPVGCLPEAPIDFSACDSSVVDASVLLVVAAAANKAAWNTKKDRKKKTGNDLAARGVTMHTAMQTEACVRWTHFLVIIPGKNTARASACMYGSASYSRRSLPPGDRLSRSQTRR